MVGAGVGARAVSVPSTASAICVAWATIAPPGCGAVIPPDWEAGGAVRTQASAAPSSAVRATTDMEREPPIFPPRRLHAQSNDSADCVGMVGERQCLAPTGMIF